MSSHPGAVAIIGIGCRFPGGVSDAAGFWKLLSDGVDAITEIPSDRIDLGHYFDPRPATPGRMMTRWGGFLDRIDEFDAYFFGISPREAERLDPQQRLLLETVWEALEDAGQDVHRLEGSATGVFVGQWLSDFEARLFADPEGVDFQMTTGSGRYASSGRISYCLGLRGPSLTLDTACSSSLVAVHLAAKSIRSGESALAIAGGVNVILQPHISVAYSQSRMMAPDGHCKFGDAGGDGYVRSEGAGLVVLKALDRAVADGDRIYAVIRGGAVNNDGRSSGSMGTPSRLGQEELLRSAYRDAGIDPAGVGYVEAHGTGTRAGDPVELGALGAVLGPGRSDGNKLRVGSVKTNIGHTEGSAGIAGLIKAALALHHGAIPPSLHCRELNPAIPWADVPLLIPRQAQDWARNERPRVAGVSAFGIAGTNAHIVMEEAPVAASAVSAVASAPRAVSLLPLSAKSPEALQALAGRYADLLERDPAAPLPELCWNAATRRTALPHRAAFAAADAPSMATALRTFGEASPSSNAVQEGASPRLVFVVPGQGAQWVGMARELLAHEPVFRAALADCDAAARPYADWSIVEQLGLAPEAAGYRLDQIDVIQPVLVAIAIAYAALWRSLGVEPDAVVGHSMGEVGAACIAGVLDLGQAMQIICRRSALMRRTSGQGAMALVELSMDEARARLQGREAEVSVAVSNSPRSSVISGHPDAVNAVMAQLERDGVFCRLVKVDVASHSPQMEPLAAELQRELSALQPQAARIPIYSTVLGRRAEGAEFDASYWARNLRQPVMFTQTVGQILHDGASVFAELGPHPVLLPSIEQTAQAQGASAVTIACGRREEPEQASFLSALGALWAAGASIDWARVMPRAGRSVALPLYPWQRERHWVAAANMAASGPARSRGARHPERRHPLLGDGVDLGGTPAGCLWELDLNLSRSPFLAEHRLHGAPVLAASAYVEMALAAAHALTSDGSEATVESLSFDQALYLNAEADAPARMQLRALADGGSLALTWMSEGEGGWTRHASAHLGASVAAPAMVAVDTSRWPAACDGATFYSRLESQGAAFGSALQSVQRAWFNGGEAFADIALPPSDRFEIAPAAIDACFQLAVAAMGGDDLWMPASVQRIVRTPDAGAPRAVQVRTRDGGRDGVRTVDVTLLGTAGLLLTLGGIELRKLAGGVQQDPRQWLFGLDWVEAPRAAAQSVAERAWLLMADRSGVAAALAVRLKEAGAAVAIVAPDVAPDALMLTPLLQQLAKGREHALAEVVYLRGTDLEAPTAEAAQALFGLVRVVQELNQFDAAPRRCTLVTRGACAAVTGDAARIATAQAPLWGLAAAVAEEHPALWGGRLDLDPAASLAAQAAWLFDELAAVGGRSAAQRDEHRWVPRLARLDAVDSAAHAAPALRPDATYLVTGGLGGVGAHVARWLVERGARRLLILGRSELPARSQWAGVPSGTREAVAVQAVRKLEALGASVQYAAVDVGDGPALRRFLASFEAEAWPPIRGVVHAAGVIDDQLVAELGEASLNTVLHGKLWGAWNLDQALPQLDMFVLFSSVASLLAQPGQASYAAANAFLDALAHQRRGRGQAALSINWGVWQDVGFAGTQGGAQALARLSRLGLAAFPAAGGLSALGLLLERDLAQAAVLPLDVAGLRGAIDAGSLTPTALALLAPLAARSETRTDDNGAGGTASFTDQLRAEEPPQQRRLLEERLVQQASGILRLAAGRLDKRTPLGSYGLNSLMALELRNRIEADLKLPLSATVLWNYPTVVALAEYLLTRLAPAAAVVAVEPSSDGAAPASASLAQAVEGIAALSDEAALAALAGGKRAGRGRR